MDKKLQLFSGIMLFYMCLSYIVFPFCFYFFIHKSLISAGNGFIVGSVISIFLWIFFGRNMIK